MVNIIFFTNTIITRLGRVANNIYIYIWFYEYIIYIYIYIYMNTWINIHIYLCIMYLFFIYLCIIYSNTLILTYSLCFDSIRRTRIIRMIPIIRFIRTIRIIRSWHEFVIALQPPRSPGGAVLESSNDPHALNGSNDSHDSNGSSSIDIQTYRLINIQIYK